jgi:hypothetical protein
MAKTKAKKTKQTPEEFVRKSAEKFLQKVFLTIGMDRPENMESILDFIVEDIMETSAMATDDYFSEGDIAIGFRRFIEREN